ncbi:MAG: hypothetical protein LC754_17100 [Acidobacteria bacterium]|nr:hypothetical protein [Acidobacteriota bacterium]
MKRFYFLMLAAVFSALTISTANAQGQKAAATPSTAPTTVNRSGVPVNVDKIIRTVAAKETEFRRALNNYEFKRDAILQTIAPLGGQITGEYHRVSRFVFDNDGNRFEKILMFPLPTITDISVTNEDLEDLGGVQAFALEASKIDQYVFTYGGKEHIDELDTYVFDVTPKILSDAKALSALKKSKTPERYFQGRIWVDDRDFQIVKAKGKGVPEFDQRFPTFETYREQINGRYWFPTYAYADDDLVFKNGQTTHVRLKVRYTDFAELKGKGRVVEEGEPGVIDEKDREPRVKPTPPPATTTTPKATAKPKP